ncbi:MAG: universal stress protein [Candidatus Omnitrophota bacterium]
MGLRILIGIDNSRFSQRAIALGIELARKSRATVAGIGVVDADGIERHSAGAAPGAYSYAEKLMDEKINDSRSKLETLLNDFEDQCKANGVACETILKSGTPVKEMINETELADLLIIGIRTYFHFETSEDPDETFEKVISHGKCPVLAVTDQELPAEMGVLIAYDGNLKANNALKAFACLNDRFHLSPEVTVLNVNEDLNEGERIVEKAQPYLQAHELNVTGKVVCGKTREVIYQTAKECETSTKTLLVIGTNGTNELSDYILGNSIKHIVEDGTIPLFIYH